MGLLLLGGEILTGWRGECEGGEEEEEGCEGQESCRVVETHFEVCFGC